MSEFVSAFFDNFYSFPDVITITQSVAILILLDGVVRFLFGSVNRFTGGR